jgi:ribonuclease HII
MSLPTLEKEFALLKQGYSFIAGLDEAGRGAWAGPVVAAAVILPLDAPTALHHLQAIGVNDSKKLSARQREKLKHEIQFTAMAYGIGHAESTEIDQLGIVPATRLAMTRAIQQLNIAPSALLIDAVRLPQLTIPQQVFNFADSISLSVAAASILAKTARDAILGALDADYPGYYFSKHKGYGTQLHQNALAKLGASPCHRHSFTPISKLNRLI